MSTGHDERRDATPSGRRPRRAVRAPGTVGTDDAVLRSTLPAVQPRRAQPSDGRAAPGRAGARVPDRSSDALLAARSADDSDVGWGGGGDDNDDRLRLDKPPHWG